MSTTKRPGLKLVAAVAVVAMGAGAWLLYDRHAQADSGDAPKAASAGPTGTAAPGGQPSGPAAPVLVVKATSKDVPIVIRGLGSVQAFNTVTVRSRVDGYITQVAFTEGQDVHRGDLLMQIDPRPFQATLDQTEASLARDQAQLANVRLDLQRYSALAKQSFAPLQQVDTQKAQVAQLEATLKSDQAAITAARLNLDYAAIRSPIDGRTGARLVDVGNLVQSAAATSLVVVTQVHPIFVTFTLPEQSLTSVRDAVGRGDVPVIAYDGDDKRRLSTGKLTLINNQIDPTTGAVTLKSQFDNTDGALWPGQFVNAHLVTSTVANGVVVPLTALATGPKGRFLYVVKQDQTADLRNVTVQQVQDNQALLSQGLKVGETVVTAGQFKLSPGMKVAVKQPTDPGAPEPTIDSPARIASGGMSGGASQ